MTPARGSGLPEREQPPQEVDTMRTPTTALDDRFSDPDAAPTPWATTVRTLADAQLFWITTVRADGRPHVTPLVAVWLDDALHFCTGAAEQKAANLRSRPDVVLTTGRDEWDRGLDVVVEGRAVRTTDERSEERRVGEGWVCGGASVEWRGR